MTKVVHLTSVHPRYDTRIFIKQCKSLSVSGYGVTLIVADGKGDEKKSGVQILDVGLLQGRIQRVIRTTRRVFKLAVRQNGDIYHIHDPELIPTGLKLKRMGRRVVFDSHEDVPRQLLGKPYLGPIRLKLLSSAFSLFEHFACKRFDGVVAATPTIRDKFLPINPNTVDVNNFPLIRELDTGASWENKEREVCYVGSISATRGIREIVAAVGLASEPIRLNLVGAFRDPVIEAEVKSMPSWQRVNEYGYLNREGVRDVLSRSVAGLVTLHPIVNYLDSLPVKMFEYMACGIPVIASDFPLWRDIVIGSKFGLCVDPLDQVAIAAAIDQIVENPGQARIMGDNGRRAVASTYNWPMEEQKLLTFYEGILQRRPK